VADDWLASKLTICVLTLIVYQCYVSAKCGAARRRRGSWYRTASRRERRASAEMKAIVWRSQSQCNDLACGSQPVALSSIIYSSSWHHMLKRHWRTNPAAWPAAGRNSSAQPAGWLAISYYTNIRNTNLLEIKLMTDTVVNLIPVLSVFY